MSSYLERVAEMVRMRKPVLPFNYILDESDPDIVKRYAARDGCSVAAFSASGATEEGIREAAMEDFLILFTADAISLALQPDEEQSER